jgi:hypothetical protein
MGDTVIVADAVVPRIDADIVAMPGATAVTTPAADTVATAALDELQLGTAETPASASTVAVSVAVWPTWSGRMMGLTLRLRTPSTVMVVLPETAPADAAMVACPRAIPVTTPPLVTLAIDGADEDQVTLEPGSIAPLARTVAERVIDPPTGTELALPVT